MEKVCITPTVLTLSDALTRASSPEGGALGK